MAVVSSVSVGGASCLWPGRGIDGLQGRRSGLAFRGGGEGDSAGSQPVPGEHGFVQVPREVAEPVDDYVLEGRALLGGLAHHPSEVAPDPRRVVVAGDDVKFAVFAELLAVGQLELPGVFLGAVAGGFLGVDGGPSADCGWHILPPPPPVAGDSSMVLAGGNCRRGQVSFLQSARWWAGYG